MSVFQSVPCSPFCWGPLPYRQLLNHNSPALACYSLNYRDTGHFSQNAVLKSQSFWNQSLLMQLCFSNSKVQSIIFHYWKELERAISGGSQWNKSLQNRDKSGQEDIVATVPNFPVFLSSILANEALRALAFVFRKNFKSQYIMFSSLFSAFN